MSNVIEEIVTGSTTSAESVGLTPWTPQAGEFVLLFVAQRDESIAISVGGNGLSWIELQNCDNVQGQGGISVWKGEGASPSTGQITVTVTGNSKPVMCAAIRVSGADGTSPVDNSAQDTGPNPDNNDMKIDITTGVASALIVAGGTHRRKNFTVPGGETEISINNTVGSGGDLTALSLWSKQAAAAGSYTLGDDNDLSGDIDWCCVAVSIAPAAAGSGGALPMAQNFYYRRRVS